MKYLAPAFLLLPYYAHAATPTNFKEFIEFLLLIIQNIIAIFMVALVTGTMYGVLLYVINSDNEKKREELRGYLIYAVVGIAVIMGMWGIIEILTTTFGWSIGIPQISAP